MVRRGAFSSNRRSMRARRVVRSRKSCPIPDDEWMSGPESQTQLRATTASKHGAKLKNQKRTCEDTY